MTIKEHKDGNGKPTKHHWIEEFGGLNVRIDGELVIWACADEDCHAGKLKESKRIIDLAEYARTPVAQEPESVEPPVEGTPPISPTGGDVFNESANDANMPQAA